MAATLVAVVGSSLFAWRAARTPDKGRSGVPARIVVLPFENLGSLEDAYFAAGLTEEIINRLANLQGVKVISRTTAVGYDRKGKTIREIGKDLDVDFVLEGAVRWDRGTGRESRVRITPQLIQVRDDTPVWAERYDGATADIFTIQSEVGENVVRAMGVKLVPREKTALATASTKDMEAYDLYLRGLEMANRPRMQQNQDAAVRLFQAAVERDPRFSQALGQLAKAHSLIYVLYYDRSPQRVDLAKDAVDRLVAIGPDLAETHMARGWYYYSGLDHPRALEGFRAALSLQPSNSDALSGMAYVLRRQGRFEEAAERMVEWLELDPRSVEALSQYGQTCVVLRRYAEADRVLAMAASLNPSFGPPWGMRGWLRVLWHGDVEEARALLADAARIPDLRDELFWVAYRSYQVTLIRRNPREALRWLDEEKRDALNSQFFYAPVELLRGRAYALDGAQSMARRAFEAARGRLEALIAKQPGEARYYSALGITFAALGLQKEALDAANRGIELMPESKDAWRWLWRIEDLAVVHTMLGQQNEAIERLNFLLSRTGEISTHSLRLEPRWDPLRANPRFQALLTKYGDPS